MSEWQPIETAPKDGTPILLGIAGPHYWPRSAWWCLDEERWVVHKGGRFSAWFDIPPTHWMPLPSPPDAK